MMIWAGVMGTIIALVGLHMLPTKREHFYQLWAFAFCEAFALGWFWLALRIEGLV